ncbi:MAG: glycosyltransferase family 39 protein [Planctomycetota bacterium]
MNLSLRTKPNDQETGRGSRLGTYAQRGGEKLIDTPTEFSPPTTRQTAHRPLLSDSPSTLFYVGCALVLGISLFAAAYRIGVPSMWMDEASSWHNVRGGWGRLFSYCVGGDDSSGLAYAHILKVWTAVVGDRPEARMRWLSIAITVAFVALMLKIGHALWGRTAGLCVGLLAALHPQVVFWSRQVRAYSLVFLATALCLWGLIVYLRSSPKKNARWLCVGACLLVLSHLFGFFFLCGMGLFLVALGWSAQREPRSLKRAIMAAAPLKWAAVLGLGWAVIMRSRIQDSLTDFWIGGTVGQNAVAMFGSVLPVFWVSGALLLAGVAMLWANRAGRTERTVLLGVAALTLPVLIGPFVATLMATGGHNFIHPRYVVPTIPVLLLPAGYLFSRVPRGFGVIAALLVAAGIAQESGTLRLYRSQAPWGDDARCAAAFLNHQVGPQDRVLLVPWCERITFEYYGVDTAMMQGTPRDNVQAWLDERQARRPAEPQANAGCWWLVLIHGEPNREYDIPTTGTREWRFGKLRILRLNDPSDNETRLNAHPLSLLPYPSD